MTRLWFDMKEDWLDKNKKLLKETSVEEMGEQDDPSLLIVQEIPEDDLEFEISDDFREIDFNVSGNGLYFSLKVPISENLLMAMMDIVVKRINKFRAAIEATK